MNLNTNDFKIEDLGIAYRKAKVDYYYSTYHSLFAIVEYEKNLDANLNRLFDQINSDIEDWVEHPEFLGDWILTPKAINYESKELDKGLVFASPAEGWANILSSVSKPSAEFRLTARCNIDFHVLSALWILKVGAFFDKKLSANVYGSRLRRNRHNDFNTLALGSFIPYLKPYREWRDGGIKAMQLAIANNKKILAMTADVTSFYHELYPEFMLDKSFHELVDVKLGFFQNKLNRLFINALKAWAQNTPLKKGLPVGLPASAVVANMALYAMDEFIEKQVMPLYYGRYVDDILLVMENTINLAGTEQFWEWILNRDGGKKLFKFQTKKKKIESIQFKPVYLKDSRITFKNSKNKLFVLSGETGSALVNAILEQINQGASEWRALPDLPNSPSIVETDLLKATDHEGGQADNLRKTDSLTLHRAGFALKLRDYEAFERDLPPEAWHEYRQAFFVAVTNHLLTPVKFFELAQYLSRIIRMATACEDFDSLLRLIQAIDGLVTSVNSCQGKIKAFVSILPADFNDRWQKPLYLSVVESVISAFPINITREGKKAWEKFLDDIQKGDSSPDWLLKTFAELEVDVLNLKKWQLTLFKSDLAHNPFRFVGLPKEMINQRGIPHFNEIINKENVANQFSEFLPQDIHEGIKILSQWLKLKNGIHYGLIFATRPFCLEELYLIAPEPFSSNSQRNIKKAIKALRGSGLTGVNLPIWDKNQVLNISDCEQGAKKTIAVTSLKTDYKSFVAAVMRKPDPCALIRYQNLNHLLNGLISRHNRVNYLVLPELSMPPQWFIRIACKLKNRGISLITGIEYLHAPKRQVNNQVWASFIHASPGYPSIVIYRQDKQRPAINEEKELFRIAGVILSPKLKWKQPPIIKHGDFFFSLLICSELTNISYRAYLRGKVDALFVPEWNQDTETFNSLIESAALDVHAYIIQCNDRQYGDSRIRAPYKDSWKRDILRVKGGITDYTVIGEIDILALRQFQSSYRSPISPFKPVPDGFESIYDRKVLPAGDTE